LARGRAGDPGELRNTAGPRKWSAWKFDWSGLDLPVWDVEGDAPDGLVIVLSHGWGDSRIGGLSRAAGMAPFASRLILWDMPGHGEAPGTCSLGTREVEALLALIERVGGQVALYGWSLGAGVSIAAAAQSAAVSAVIAEAPYRLAPTPARNVLQSIGMPWRVNLPLAMWLLGSRFGVGPNWTGFDRVAIAAKLHVPLLVIHGQQDDICPIQDGRGIVAGAKSTGTMCEVANGGHHSLWTDPDAAPVCAGAVEIFLKGVMARPLATPLN
jgi:pimeloyl-ACP methyl ester carboxylesterase